MSARSPGSCSLTRSRRICTRRGGRTTLVARTLRRRPPSNSRGSRGHRTRRMDSWLAVLCELHKRNLLSGAPSDAEHVQGVARDAPLSIGTPSSGMAHRGANVSGHHTFPRALPDQPSTAHAPSIAALQPKMRRMWGSSGRLGRPSSGLLGLRTLAPTGETHRTRMVSDLRRSGSSGSRPGLITRHQLARATQGLAANGLCRLGRAGFLAPYLR